MERFQRIGVNDKVYKTTLPDHRNCEVLYNDPEERIVVLKYNFPWTKMMMGTMGGVYVKDPTKTITFINLIPKIII